MGWGMAMMAVMVALGIALVVVVVWLVQNLTRPRDDAAPAAAPDREEPLRVLERRFAEGEIGPDEYRERRSALESRG